MNMHSRSLALGAVLLSLLATAPAALAQTAAFSLIDASSIAVGNPNGTNTNGGVGVGNDAYVFTVGAEDISVTALGIFSTTAGLLDAHPIAIYANGTNTALAQVVVPASGPISSNGFQYVSIAPLTLTANTTYVLADAYGPSFNDAQNIGGLTTNSAITYGGYFYDRSTTLDNAVLTPANDGVFYDGSTSYVGSNFEFTAIPEPSTYALLIGIFAFGFIIVRRQLSQMPVA